MSSQLEKAASENRADRVIYPLLLSQLKTLNNPVFVRWHAYLNTPLNCQCFFFFSKFQGGCEFFILFRCLLSYNSRHISNILKGVKSTAMVSCPSVFPEGERSLPGCVHLKRLRRRHFVLPAAFARSFQANKDVGRDRFWHLAGTFLFSSIL